MRLTLTRRGFLHNSLLILPGLGLASSLPGKAKGKTSFKLGIITDEVTDDLKRALEFISECSLGYCELRQIWEKNIINLSQEELRRAKGLVEEHHLQVADIASPLFKYNLPEMPARADEKRDTFRADFTDQDTNDLLRKAFEIAHLFGTTKVRIFSYWRVDEPEKAYPYVRDRLAKAAEVAGRNGIVLALENEATCNVGTGKELGHILREINSPHLRGTWDPGNATVLGEVPYPDGYQAVRGLFVHMHVKDAKKQADTGELRWVPVGSGFIDFKGQFRALRQDGYNETICLETHYRRADGNALESTRESLEGLLKILKEIA